MRETPGTSHHPAGGSAGATAPALKSSATTVNWPIFIGSALSILLLSLWAILAPASAGSVLGSVVSWVTTHWGWFYVLTGVLVLAFVSIVAVSRYGDIRLGPDHSRPAFSFFSWAAMLFAAGIGADLMFYSVFEPLLQYFDPPRGEGQTAAAAQQAVAWTIFHYGLVGWGMYSLMGLAFGYFAFRFNLPLSIRSALYPIIGRRINGLAGGAVTLSALLGTVFGVATSLGIGVVQINYGLQLLFGWERSLAVQIGLIVVAVLMTIASATSGIDRGIRRLSELNIFLAIALMVYVLLMGDTSFLLNALVMNIGDAVFGFGELALDTMAYDQPGDWMSSWTIFFWAWWVAWAPFVGLFLARISRGRTIRQFVAATLTVPFLFVLIWISIFGNSTLDLIYHRNQQGFAEAARAEPESAFFTLLEQYPGAPFVIAVATFTGLLFYVTSADSGSLIMANFTCTIEDPDQDGPRWMRIFWASITGLLTCAMLFVGGIPTLVAATIIFGLPFTVVLYLTMAGIWQALSIESNQQSPTRGKGTWPKPSSLEPPQAAWSWRQRLEWMLTYPGASEAETYLNTVVKPALTEVCQELAARGAHVSLHCGHDAQTHLPLLTLRERTTGRKDFMYQVQPRAALIPRNLLGAATPDADTYYRLEPQSGDGSSSYDIFGYTKEQVIHDVLDLYDSYRSAHQARD
ncbi:choline BCCT transporter BetT [Rothia nasimurium]|uniref:choline BCCT transporter BetT n=1 Tax=Rothia nasimurium TaxID=85336 RepID=UPI001F025546|nr:choline BCCT transporter BetT [Rothia nasimurium]